MHSHSRWFPRSNLKLATPLIVLFSMLSVGLMASRPLSLLAEPFAPSWNLMNSEQKQYFISGYLKSQSDAIKIIDVTMEYVRLNPQSAMQGLGELRKLYDLSALAPVELSSKLDTYYADPEHREKPLSQAISAIKNR